MATILANLRSFPNSSSTPWRPPQWKNSAMFFVTINGSVNAPAPQNGLQVGNTPDSSGLYQSSGTLKLNGTTSQVYVFDAVLSAEHRQEARVTEHPVQTGSVISDHAFILPAEITLDIGMSDAMQAYAFGSNDLAINSGAWTAPALSGPWGPGSGGYVVPKAQTGIKPINKSVNAYQTLLSWATGRVLMSLTTRLITYTNVMVQSVNPQEKSDTVTGLRCRVVFRQIFLADTISYAGQSARPQDTQNTPQGQSTPTPPTAPQIAQYGGKSGSTALGAGDWSSNAVAVK